MCISFFKNVTNFGKKRGQIILTFMPLKHTDVEGEEEPVEHE